MRMFGVPAGDIGVETFDLVREAHFLEEVERAIDGRRLGRALAVQVRQQVIGLGGLFAFEQEVQHLSAYARQLLALAGDKGFSFRQKCFSLLRTARRIGVGMRVRVSHGPYVG